MKNKGMYLGHFSYANGGLVRMDPGGPTNPAFKFSYDIHKSPTENAELNRRAQVAGWNSVAEYEKAGWDYNKKPAPVAQPVQQKPTSFYNNPKDHTLENSGYPYKSDNNQKEQSWGDKVGYQPMTEWERKKVEEEQKLANENWEKVRRSPAYTDHAGLPSVPIFEAAFMAPVALSTAGTVIGEGMGLAGEGLNAAKSIAQPVSNAWNASMNTKLLGDAGIFASEGSQLLSNLATPANLLKGWGLYDATNKYGPGAISNLNDYYNTGDTEYLKDAGYNTAKAVLELGSHTGPIAHEVSAAKKPISLIDDTRKTFDSNKDLSSRGISGFKTFKNVMGYLKAEGGDISVPSLKRVKIKSLPKNWKTQ